MAHWHSSAKTHSHRKPIPMTFKDLPEAAKQVLRSSVVFTIKQSQLQALRRSGDITHDEWRAAEACALMGIK